MAFQTNCLQLADLLKIVNAALEHTWLLTLEEAAIIWEEHSLDYDATWHILDGLSNKEIWTVIEKYSHLITWKAQ